MEHTLSSKPLWTGRAFDRAAINELARDLRNAEPAISWAEAQRRAWALATIERRNDEAAIRNATTEQLRRDVAEAYAAAKAESAPAEPKWTGEIRAFRAPSGEERECLFILNVGAERAAAAHCDPTRQGPGWRLVSSDGDLTDERWSTAGRALATVAPFRAPELDAVAAAESRLAAASLAAAAGEDPSPPQPPARPNVLPLPSPRPEPVEPLPLAARALACAQHCDDPVVRSAPIDASDGRSRQVRRAEQREAEKRAREATLTRHRARNTSRILTSLSAAAVIERDDIVPTRMPWRVVFDRTGRADTAEAVLRDHGLTADIVFVRQKCRQVDIPWQLGASRGVLAAVAFEMWDGDWEFFYSTERLTLRPISEFRLEDWL